MARRNPQNLETDTCAAPSAEHVEFFNQCDPTSENLCLYGSSPHAFVSASLQPLGHTPWTAAPSPCILPADPCVQRCSLKAPCVCVRKTPSLLQVSRTARGWWTSLRRKCRRSCQSPFWESTSLVTGWPAGTGWRWWPCTRMHGCSGARCLHLALASGLLQLACEHAGTLLRLKVATLCVPWDWGPGTPL